jgi:hypothetical protein
VHPTAKEEIGVLRYGLVEGLVCVEGLCPDSGYPCLRVGGTALEETWEPGKELGNAICAREINSGKRIGRSQTVHTVRRKLSTSSAWKTREVIPGGILEIVENVSLEVVPGGGPIDAASFEWV